MRIRHPAADEGKKIVVVVGSGFAGLNAAKALSQSKEVAVFLIDQRNYHLFQPLLYQVATAGLNSGEIAVPIRAQFPVTSSVHVHLDKVVGVHLKDKFVRVLGQSEGLEIEFDYLVLACGAQHSYFGHPEWEEFAPGLKTLEQAAEIRRRILLAFEHAENALELETQEAFLNFIVVGGGPTGVELAGAIADISRTVLLHDFKRIDPSKAKIILVEAGPRLLSPFSEELSERARRDLIELGVDVRLGARVEHIDEHGVLVNGETIRSRAVIWAAGVQAVMLDIEPTVATDRAGRIKVNSDLSIPEYPDAFVIGDMASLEVEPGKLVPGLAPAAIQEGKHVAHVILSSIKGELRQSFRYLDKGQTATIGRNKAIMQTGRFKATGHFAWLAWLFIHVFYLIGFKNRLAVMFTWAWSYLRSKRGARLISEHEWRLNPKLSEDQMQLMQDQASGPKPTHEVRPT